MKPLIPSQTGRPVISGTPMAALLSLLVVLAGVGIPGCSILGGQENTGFVERGVYPANRKQTRTLDIQVARDETVIRFTNTTAHPIPACTMWINAWYSRDVPAIGVGETVRLNLFEFKDQYGEEFRAGGFFATDKPMRLVLAQLALEEELVGLVVVGDYE